MARANETQQKRTNALGAAFEPLTSILSGPVLIVLFSSLALCVIGVVMVYSASSITLIAQNQAPYSEAIKQIAFTVLGLILCALAFRFGDEDSICGPLGLVFYGICIVLIILTGIAGSSALGATRWFSVGGVSLQGSEFAKIGFVIMAARIISKYKSGEYDLVRAGIWTGVAIVLPLVFLLVTQSDLGTTMICGVSIIALMLLSGCFSPKLIVGVLVVSVLVAALAICTSSYRLARVTGFLDPWADANSSGYQLIHSYKALATGGLFGLGLGNSYQKMDYLPEAETDFIFAIIGEEMGLVGCLIVIGLFVALLVGGLSIAKNCDTDFGCMVAGSLTTMIVFQAMLNIFCVIGLAPVTGKPLPFISSGGSSLISSLILIGLVLAMAKGSGDVHGRRRADLHVVSSAQPSARGGNTTRSSHATTNTFVGSVGSLGSSKTRTSGLGGMGSSMRGTERQSRRR